MADVSSAETVQLSFKWRTVEYTLPDMDPNTSRVIDVKQCIQNLTGVLVERQKILGLGKAGQLVDSATIGSLGLKFKDKSFKFTLMGTPETELVDLNAKANGVSETVFNDLSCEFSSSTAEWQKLHEFTNATSINFIHEPRADKKLLVLDLDHTILHFTSKEEVTSAHMKRPHMDTFLSDVYAHYDIAIWSQTHWKWVEIKLIELGMLTHSNYRICFVLDKSSMFSMSSGKVKPLHLIWAKYPQYWGKHNTIHVDDLARNFVLNKSSGLLIAPYSRPSRPKPSHDNSSNSSNNSTGDSTAHHNTSGSSSSSSAHTEEPDVQLLLLSRYLRKIANHNDLSSVDHSKWHSNL